MNANKDHLGMKKMILAALLALSLLPTKAIDTDSLLFYHSGIVAGQWALTDIDSIACNPATGAQQIYVEQQTMKADAGTGDSMIVRVAPHSMQPIVNDTFWKTVSGTNIYSQGGGIFRFTDAQTGKQHYYWYGVRYTEAESYAKAPTGGSKTSTFKSVTCYRSDDLVNWTSCGDVLTYDEVNSHEWPYWVGRLGVAYVASLKKYALLVQYNSQVLIATATKPTGPFKWQNTVNMTSMIGTSNTGDQTVFTDRDGKSYLVYSYGKGRSRIYLSEIGSKDGKVALLDCHQIYKGSGREGNCMFRYKNKYYMCASDLYGWNASHAYYLVADNIYGPYTPTNQDESDARLL